MRFVLVVMSALLVLIVAGTTGAANNDQGRRLAGPFCVGKANLNNLEGKRTGLSAGKTTQRFGILRAGAVRSVASISHVDHGSLGSLVLLFRSRPGAPGPQGERGP